MLRLPNLGPLLSRPMFPYVRMLTKTINRIDKKFSNQKRTKLIRDRFICPDHEYVTEPHTKGKKKRRRENQQPRTRHGIFVNEIFEQKSRQQKASANFMLIGSHRCLHSVDSQVNRLAQSIVASEAEHAVEGGRNRVLFTRCALGEARVESDDIACGFVGGEADGQHVGCYVPVDTLGARRRG